jgi:hypothetical protein
MRMSLWIPLLSILALSNILVPAYFSFENRRLEAILHREYSLRVDTVSRYWKLQDVNRELNRSYYEVVEANRGLENALSGILDRLRSTPYNYTLIPSREFSGRFLFAYTEEMRVFVFNLTGGWDGSDNDFRSDLYKIYMGWRSIFVYVFPPPYEVYLPLINIGSWNYAYTYYHRYDPLTNESTWCCDEYLREVSSCDIVSTPISGASISFRYRQGGCWDFAVVLVSLYYAYYDIAGRSLPTVYISIGAEGVEEFSHACVLVKLEGDRVAILDWEPITVSDGMIEFLPFDLARRLHSRYWWGWSILYKGFMMGRPYRYGSFGSNEEFYRWLVEALG